MTALASPNPCYSQPLFPRSNTSGAEAHRTFAASSPGLLVSITWAGSCAALLAPKQGKVSILPALIQSLMLEERVPCLLEREADVISNWS